MTQADAKLTVLDIKKQLENAIRESGIDRVFPEFMRVRDSLAELAANLDIRKPAKPNCRPVTAADLQQLCAASNVVIFNPAA